MAATMGLTSVENSEQEAMLKDLWTKNNHEDVREVCNQLIANAKNDLSKSNSLHLYEAANYIRNEPELDDLAEELYKLVLNFNDLYGCGAINSYCFSWLIPSGKLDLAVELLGHSISLEVGEESINSLSNYAQVLIKKGSTQDAEIIFAWIRCSDSPLLRPEANYFLAHLGRSCQNSDVATKLLREITESGDSSYVQLAKECFSGKCTFDQTVTFTIESPAFLNGHFSSIESCFPEFTSEIPFDLPADIEHGWKSKSFFEKLSASDGKDFSQLLPYFISAVDPSDNVVREIINRHIPRALMTNDWVSALFLVLKFGLANKSVALAEDAAKILIKELSTSGSIESAKILAIAQALLLEIFVRMGKINEAHSFAATVVGNKSAEWSFAVALLAIVEGRSEDALEHLAVGLDLGHSRTKLLNFAVRLMTETGYTNLEDEITNFDKERREWGEPSHTGLPAEARQFWFDVERVLSGEESGNGEILIGAEVLACSIAAVFMKLPALATETIIRSEQLIPEDQIDNFSFGIGGLLDKIHDITLARTDLSRFPSVVSLMESVGFIEVIIALAQNPKVDPVFTGENLQLANAARGVAAETDLLHLASHENLDVQLLVAGSTTLTENVFAKLAESKHQQVLDLLCTRPDAPVNIVEEVLDNASSQTLWKIASGEHTSQQILRILSGNKADSVRRAVAANPGTSSDVLEALALDSAWAVREQIVSNPNASDNAKALAALQS